MLHTGDCYIFITTSKTFITIFDTQIIFNFFKKNYNVLIMLLIDWI